MNKKIAEFFKLESVHDPWQHIHATGSYGWRWMPEYVRQLGVDLAQHPNIDMREYIYNMPDLMAAADVIICRGGSSTLNEVAAAGTPCIIVPSPQRDGQSPGKKRSHSGKAGLRRRSCWSATATARRSMRRPRRCWPIRPARQDAAGAAFYGRRRFGGAHLSNHFRTGPGTVTGACA